MPCTWRALHHRCSRDHHGQPSAPQARSLWCHRARVSLKASALPRQPCADPCHDAIWNKHPGSPESATAAVIPPLQPRAANEPQQPPPPCFSIRGLLTPSTLQSRAVPLCPHTAHSSFSSWFLSVKFTSGVCCWFFPLSAMYGGLSPSHEFLPLTSERKEVPSPSLHLTPDSALPRKCTGQAQKLERGGPASHLSE